jgi:1-acyl-sn-glycerol-3-phosphate acyltransferase
LLYYKIIAPTVKYALRLYIKRLGVEGIENIPIDKPVLFAATHSNSFLDALYLTTSMGYPVYAMARGDAFNKPFVNKVLTDLRMLPIYRLTDGDSDSAKKNEATFDKTIQLFRENQNVLIFPESFCKHQTSLLILKKGIGVMAHTAWSEGIPLQIVPVGITYDGFNKFGNKCDIIFGQPITVNDIADMTNVMTAWQSLGPKLTNDMKAIFPSPRQFQTKIKWGIWSQIYYYWGWIFNFPVYLLAMFLAKKATKGSVFYDSAVVGIISLLLLVYWPMILLIAGICFFF